MPEVEHLKEIEGKNGNGTFDVWKVEAPLSQEGYRKYNSLFGLAYLKEEIFAQEIEDRFNPKERKKLVVKFRHSKDVAYFATEAGANNVVSTVQLFSSKEYGDVPPLGIICNVRTEENFYKRGICLNLMKIVMEEWFNKNGTYALLALHTENPIAYDIYKKLGFQNWYGSWEKLAPNGKDKEGMVMFRANDGTQLEEVVEKQLTPSANNLKVERLMRSDYAPFFFLVNCEQKDVALPSLEMPNGTQAEFRFIYRTINPSEKDILVKLKAGNMLVGIAALTHPGAARKTKDIMYSSYVLPRFKEEGESFLKKESGYQDI